jgi:hypothetical protein
LADIWKDLAKIGTAIELRNPFVDNDDEGDVFWIGTIVYFAGIQKRNE